MPLILLLQPGGTTKPTSTAPPPPSPPSPGPPSPPPPSPQMSYWMCWWLHKHTGVPMSGDCYSRKNYDLTVHSDLKEDQKISTNTSSALQDQDTMPATSLSEITLCGFHELSYTPIDFSCGCARDDCVDQDDTLTVRAPPMCFFLYSTPCYHSTNKFSLSAGRMSPAPLRTLQPSTCVTTCCTLQTVSSTTLFRTNSIPSPMTTITNTQVSCQGTQAMFTRPRPAQSTACC